MTKEIAEDINAYAPVDGRYGEGMPGNMSSQTYIEIQFFSYPAENAILGARLGHTLGVQ